MGNVMLFPLKLVKKCSIHLSHFQLATRTTKLKLSTSKQFVAKKRSIYYFQIVILNKISPVIITGLLCNLENLEISGHLIFDQKIREMSGNFTILSKILEKSGSLRILKLEAIFLPTLKPNF